MMINTSDNIELGEYAAVHAHMEPWAYNATAVALFLIGFFGFFLNLFVIVLMCKDIQVSRFESYFVGFLKRKSFFYSYNFVCLSFGSCWTYAEHFIKHQFLNNS